MNLSADLQKTVDAFSGLVSFGTKRAVACAPKAYYEEVKTDETYEEYIKRFRPTLSKRDEVFAKWMEGEPAFQEGYYRLMFAKGLRDRCRTSAVSCPRKGKDRKYPEGAHRQEHKKRRADPLAGRGGLEPLEGRGWPRTPYVHSPDGRLLLFSHPSKGDVVLGMTTPEGQKLVAVYSSTKTVCVDRYAKALLSASKAVQALVGEESKLSPWDPRLGVHGTPLPSLVGMALEPLPE